MIDKLKKLDYINLSQFALLFISLFFILLYLIIALKTISYPYQLEWMEAGTLEVMKRILAGKEIYTEPDISYVAYIYTPLYYIASAIMAKLTGIDFLAPRLVSFISFLSILILSYKWLVKENIDRKIALICIGLFAACFEISGSWYHIARVDSLFLLLIFLAFYFLHNYKCNITAIFAGIVLFSAFMTKQTSLVISLPVILAYFFIDKKRALLFAATFFALLIPMQFYLSSQNSWYKFFIFELPGYHEIFYSIIISFWVKDIFKTVPIAFILSAFAILIMFFEDRKKAIFYASVIIGMVGGAYASRLHSGGWINVIMPAYLILTFMTGFALQYGLKYNNKKLGPIKFGNILYPFIICAMLIQFASVFYDPFKYIPKQTDKMAGDKFVKYLSSIDGNVLVPMHRFLSDMSGKKIDSIGMAGDDVLRMNIDSKIKSDYTNKIKYLIDSKYYEIIITSQKQDFYGHLDHYKFIGKVFNNNNELMPVTGGKVRPNFIYKLKDDKQP